MITTKLDIEILNKLGSLNGNQKEFLLDYIDHLPKMRHSVKRYRRKAMRDIRNAIDNQG